MRRPSHDAMDVRWRVHASLSARSIAYTSGFNDYNYFSQKFRRRFGYAPSAHAGKFLLRLRSSKASVNLLPDQPNEA
jgi:AraC-like DNA-binding protein